VIDPKKTFLAQQMLGYDVEKVDRELDDEGNTLSKKLVISPPVILYGSGGDGQKGPLVCDRAPP